MGVEKFIEPIKRRLLNGWQWMKQDMKRTRIEDYPAHNPPAYSTSSSELIDSYVTRERRDLFRLMLNGQVTSERVTRKRVLYPMLTVADIEKTVGTLNLVKGTGKNWSPKNKPPAPPTQPTPPSPA